MSSASAVPSSTPSRQHSLTSATPVASLHTPKPKRPALGRIPSFSAADISNVGTAADISNVGTAADISNVGTEV